MFCFFIAVPRVAREDRVRCSKAPLATVRLCETEFVWCPEFTVHGFQPSTSDATGVLQHGCLRLRLRDFFFEVYSSRSAVFH